MYITDKTIPVIFNRIRTGSTMMVINGYENNFGEVANHWLVFHVDYIKAVKKAIAFWQKQIPQNNLEKLALQELIASYKDTLAGKTRSTSAHAYRSVYDQNEIIRGIKWHPINRELHLWGFRVKKKILIPGTYPNIKKGSKRIIKDRFRTQTPVGKFVQFRLVHDQFKTISLEKNKLTSKDLDKVLI